MNIDPSSNILNQYINASNKLKKRFLRKPNVTEACDSFVSLGQQCENHELPTLAGMCWIAAARCENSTGNSPGETACLSRAARQFIGAEEYDRELGCVSPSEESLQAAINCYALATNKHSPKSPISVSLNLEIVHFLKKIDRLEHAESFLSAAINSSEDNSDTKIYSLDLLAKNFISTGDYVAALDTFTEIVDIVSELPLNGSRSELLLRCEISRVFLLLILRPTPQKLSPNLGKLLEKYTWGHLEGNDKMLKACGMSDKTFILLQSLVILCQSADAEGLVHLEGEFWNLLSNEERTLLRILVSMYT